MKYYYIETNNGYLGCSVEDYVMSDNIDAVESHTQNMADEASKDFMAACIDEDNPDEVANYEEQSGYKLEELTQVEAHELIVKGVNFLEM